MRRVLLWLVFLVPAIGIGIHEIRLFRTTPLAEWGMTFLRQVGFYTIITNVLLAVMAGALLWGRGGRFSTWVGRPVVQTGASLHITFVGIAFWTLLGGSQWDELVGITGWVSELFSHTLAPILGFAWFVLAVPKSELRWGDTLRWVTLPSIYYVYWIALGGVIGTYPYFFMDFPTLGWGGSIQWAVQLLVFVLVLGALFMGIARVATRGARA